MSLSDMPSAPESNSRKRCYVVKVQSGREDWGKQEIERLVKARGLEQYFGEIAIPTEKYSEIVDGKCLVKLRKVYPGYIMVRVERNDLVSQAFRDVSWIGDFVGECDPESTPPPRIIDRAIDTAKPGRFHQGQRVTVNDGRQQRISTPWSVC